MKIKLLTSLLSVVFTTSIFGQVTPEWLNLYSSPDTIPSYNVGTSMVLDHGGNSFTLGYAEDTTGNFKSFLFKYSPDGFLIWSDTLSIKWFYSQIVLDDSDDVYMCSMIYDSTSVGPDYLIEKFNSEGILEWSKKWNSVYNNEDEPWGIITDKNNNVYVTGQSRNPSTSYFDVTTVKYDRTGNLLWSKYESTTDQDASGQGLAVDDDQNLYVTARSLDFANGSSLLLKYDSAGNLIWSRRFKSGFGNCYLIRLVSDPTIFVAGSIVAIEGDAKFLCLKYDSSGLLLWADSFKISSSDAFTLPKAIATDDSGNVIIGGSTDNDASADYLTVKYRSDGILEWARTYDGNTNGWDQVQSVVTDHDGKVYAFGESSDTGFNHSAFVTIIYDENGNQLNLIKLFQSWQSTYPTSKIALDSLNNIYESGTQVDSIIHFMTLKYGQSVGIPFVNSEGSIKVFPNPAQNLLTINLSSSLADATVVVYDVAGRKILLPTTFSNNTAQLNTAMLSDGIYLLQITNNKTGKSAIEKFVKE